MSPTVKTCFKCKVAKPITDFYVHPAMGDGRLNKCKECTRKDVSKNYRDNIGHYIAYEAQRAKRYQANGKKQEWQERRRARHPEKYWAHTAVSNAVRDGRLFKKPCEVCGNPKAQAHHDDYSKPLDVRWLCRTHHLQVHGKIAYESVSVRSQ